MTRRTPDDYSPAQAELDALHQTEERLEILDEMIARTKSMLPKRRPRDPGRRREYQRAQRALTAQIGEALRHDEQRRKLRDQVNRVLGAYEGHVGHPGATVVEIPVHGGLSVNFDGEFQGDHPLYAGEATTQDDDETDDAE